MENKEPSPANSANEPRLGLRHKEHRHTTIIWTILTTVIAACAGTITAIANVGQICASPAVSNFLGPICPYLKKNALWSPPVPPPPPDPDFGNWSVRGLNATTKTLLPIAVIAPEAVDPTHYQDQPAADAISRLLQMEQFNIVAEPKAALLIEVVSVEAHATTSGKPCSASREEWLGTASIQMKVFWAGGREIHFPDPVWGEKPGCTQDDAINAARSDALEKINDRLLTLTVSK